MKTSYKIAITFASSLLIVLFIFFIMLNVVDAKAPEELVYPPGNLSESIFDSQNTKYSPVDVLPNVHDFKNLPYTFDVPAVDSAVVGNNGTIYEAGKDMILYVSEYKKGEDVSAIVKSEMSKAVLLDRKEELTVLQDNVHEVGYINGFGADYYVSNLTVSNGDKVSTSYMVGYDLELPEEYDYNIYICIASMSESTEVYKSAKSWLDIFIGTFQYSEEKYEKMLRMEEAAKEEAAKEEKKKTLTDSDTSKVTDETKSSTTENKNDASMPKEMEVPIENTYTDLTLYYNWTNTDKPVALTLYSPDRTSSYKPVTNANGVAEFHVGAAEKGSWIMSIAGDYGTCNVKLYDPNVTNIE